MSESGLQPMLETPLPSNVVRTLVISKLPKCSMCILCQFPSTNPFTASSLSSFLPAIDNRT